MANYMNFTGEIYWAKVLGDPVPNYNRDGNEWAFDFVPDAKSLKDMLANGLKEKIKGRGYNIGKNGQYAEREPFVRLVQKEFKSNGKRNDPINVVDARNQAWDQNTKIGNKSFVEVKVNVADYGKGKPLGVYPQAIRVLDFKKFVREEFAPLEEGNPYLDNFPEVSEDFMQDELPAGDPLNAQ